VHVLSQAAKKLRETGMAGMQEAAVRGRASAVCGMLGRRATGWLLAGRIHGKPAG